MRKDNTLINTRASNTLIYVVLLVISIAFCCISVLFDLNDKLFTLFSSVGCSGIVSVIVAWLIESSNYKKEIKRNKELVECILIDYDAMLAVEMENIISTCAKYQDIDMNAEYCIDDILGFMDILDEKNFLFTRYHGSVKSTLEKIQPISILYFERTEYGVDLFQQIERLRGYINVISTINEESLSPELVKFLSLETLRIIKTIENTRGKIRKYKVSEENKKYIQSFRKKANNNSEEV